MVLSLLSLGLHLARAYGVNDLAGGVVAVATLFAGLPNQMPKFLDALGVSDAGVAATDKINGVLTGQGLAAWKPLFAAATTWMLVLTLQLSLWVPLR